MNTTLKQIIKGLLNAEDASESMPIDNYIIYPQTWSSTTLGFGGIGGSALTTAPTIAIESMGQIFVFFGERFAYSKAVEELPEEIYSRIFKRYDAPSVMEFNQLVPSAKNKK